MATNTDQIITQLVADTKKFDGAMNGSIQVLKRFNKAGEEIGSRVRVVTRHMTEASKETDGFRVTMTRLSRDIKVAGTIFNTLEEGIKKAYSAASEGAKIMAAEQFFKNAGKSIAEYRKATNGMVSDAELMKKANLADSMGIDEKTFKKLVMVAEASALKTGQSFDYMFNSIIVGTARSSRLLLDNLGIIVSVGQANESYAKSIGKTVEQLTDQEKQLAFVAEVARKSQGTLDEYAQTTDRTAESFARFEANIQNIIDLLKVGFAEVIGKLLPDVNKLFEDMRAFIENGNWWELGVYIGYRLLAGLTETLKIGGSGLWKGWMESIQSELEAKANLLVSSSKTKKMNANSDQEDALVKMIGSYRKLTGADAFVSREQILQNVADTSEETLKAFRESGDDTSRKLADLIKVMQTVALEIGQLPKKTGIPDTRTSGGRKKKKPEEKKDYPVPLEERAMYGTGFKGESLLSSILEDTIKKKATVVLSPDKNFAAPFNSGVVQFGRNAEQFNDYLKDNAKRQTEIFDDWLLRFGQVMGSSVEQIMTGQGLAKPLANIATEGDLTGGVMDMLGSALSGTTLAPMLATVGAPGGPLGMAIGAIVGVLLDLVDSLKPVMDLIGGILSGITQLIGNALLEFLTPLSMLAGPLNDLLAAIGLVVGSALRPFVAIFTVVVGVVSVVVQAFTFLITVLSPFVEGFVWIISMILSSGLQLFPLFMDLADTTEAITDAMNTAIGVMLSAAIGLNNAIVSFAKNTLKLKGFGTYLNIADFKGPPPDEDENKDALNENTKALKDFTREFRNLPQSYKGTGAIYAAQDRQGRRGFNRVSFDIGRDGVFTAASLYRWRS